jgi:exodeoxyribonuclease V beta subunit
MDKFINNLAYEASAGSGKTFMLVVRYISLLFRGAKPNKILALTFTNKAASEMSERIVSTLQDLQNRGELEEILKVTGFTKEYILENREKILEEFLNSHTKIMTIDSFFTSILRKFSLYKSLMPDFTTFSTQHEIKLLSRFLNEVSVAGKKETLISLAVSSKKRITDIFTLLDEFYIKFSELKQINFTKQKHEVFEQIALDNMKELKKLIQGCKKASKSVVKAVEAESFDDVLAKAWLGRDTLEYRTFSVCFEPEMDKYLCNINEAVKNYHRVKEQNFFYSMKELVDIYVKSKRALYVDDSELSFSDVTSLVYEILNLIDDSEFLYFRLDSAIEHMLLDEFQDTSILQYEILKPLINEITSGSGIFEEGSFFFVGDVKQSIYRFRGGVSALFENVKNENNTQVQKLLTNYRSQKQLVNFVNLVFKDKIKNYTNQLVLDGTGDGYVEVVQNDDILEEVATKVKLLISLGANVNEVAILVATNGDGEDIKHYLQSQNIQVVTETTTKLINQKSIKAMLEYLKYQYFSEDIYRHNFFALAGLELQNIQKIDINNVKLLDIVKKAIDEYGLFGGAYLKEDANLTRFLDAIRKYKDIESLLFEYERLDVSAAASELNGIRVLTIHKSKGLEYEHILVMDRIKKPPPARNTIIYEYEGISLQNIYLRTKNRDKLDNEYKNALEKEKILVYEDNLNALYVAFTRARGNLFVIKKSEKSMFDILNLEELSLGELHLSTPKNNEDEKVYEEFKYQNFCYGVQKDIFDLESDTAQDIKSINFGLSLHYMLEMLHDFKLSSVTQAKNIMLNKYGALLDDKEVQDIENRVKLLLQHDEFKKLSDGERFKEQAIVYENNLRYIDLLIKKENNRWIIIDYKSSESYKHKHIKQLEFYIKAIKNITNDEVDGYICYLLEHEIKIVKI